jgi:2-dehydro-3-deoxyphosphogluconate aldolase/(4S)-4-hydroxy-2-oxoglutarate aldolase
MQPKGIVAVLRGSDPKRVEAAARALADGGLTFIEITFTVLGALDVIQKLTALANLVVGAGTVTSVEQARLALSAGARFLVSPACLPELVAEAKVGEAACILGALTPSEILQAWRAGADQVKVFPVARVGGPAYLKDLAGPYPQIPLMPSGGIAIDELPQYRLANVASIALGSELAPSSAITSGDLDEIRQRAKRAMALMPD